MKNYCTLVLVIFSLLIAACAGPIRGVDTTPPDITVIVNRGIGDKIYRASDVRTGFDECIKVPAFPADIQVIVGDVGGVRNILVQTITDSIVADSISTGPESPELTYTVGAITPLQDGINATLTPPTSDTVRTGAVINLSLIPQDLGFTNIIVVARDYAGNSTVFPQLDIRPASDQVSQCRGDQT